MINNFMEKVAREAAVIDQAMRHDIAAVSTGFDPLLIEILEYGLFSGGKRVRPLLTILGARLCGRADSGVISLATAFEYLHVATLFHDDVIDNASTRRGRPSVNQKFGMVGAILAGDFLHARALSLIGEYGGAEALKIFSEATHGMVDGEFVQLRNQKNYLQSEDDYFSVIMGKTALLIGAACEIGGLAGGGSEQERAALKKYGLSLGSAFQIIDDLLDYLGDEKKTGKAPGNDLAEGKLTLPLILAIQRAEEADRLLLLEILENEPERAARVKDVIDLIKKYHGFADAATKAETIVAEGLQAMDIFKEPDQQEISDILKSLAQYILTREK